ncbi:MAG: PEP-CTERM sorting domain-containing protein, partial [Verrucomicrobia bacterium]|nr:PEP-CTERM sorting domain-containing protein [Verrucomicrobiota bacterium]
ANWATAGSNSAIILRSANNFAANSGDPTCDFALDAGNGSLIFGTQTANSITAAAVPEPSVTAMLVLGALGLGALRLRRQTV